MDEKLLSGINDFTADVKTFGEAVDKFLGLNKGKVSSGSAVDKAAEKMNLQSNMKRSDGSTFNPYAQNKPIGGAISAPDGSVPAAGAAAAGNLKIDFTGDSGGESNFSQLNPSVKNALSTAADNYFQQTGKKLQLNSAVRTKEDQQRLWDESVKLGHAGIGPNGMEVAYPGTSAHEKGLAVDIQNYKDPAAIKALAGEGLFQTRGAKDPVHFQRARFGGVFNGSSNGYPVELHGREAVVPMPDPSSRINIESASPNKEPLSSVVNNSSNSTVNTTDMMSDIFAMMSNKMDDMIDRLDRGNNYSDKLVKAMA